MTDEQFAEILQRLDRIESEIDFLRNWVTTPLRIGIETADAYVGGTYDVLEKEWNELLARHDKQAAW